MTSFAPRASWNRFRRAFGSDGLRGRLMRGSVLTMGSFAASQILRLASSLILTRLLFPEAFGLMVLLQVVLSGLLLLSDTGLRVSVVQNARGDDPAFLDTVWTVKVIRGVILWGIACLLAVPLSRLYDEPLIAQMLPVIGLTLILKGFVSTAGAKAERHIKLGRLTAVRIGSQTLGILAAIVLAWLLGTVWALVFGTIFGTLSKVVLVRMFLPHSRNRFHWDMEIVRELFHFGKWILVGTTATYLAKNLDKMILGAYVPLDELGIYSIGTTLAMISFTVCEALKTKLLMPLYRMRPIQESEANRRKIFLMRRLISASGIVATAAMALVAIPLVGLLYDDRYALAGPIVALLCLSLIPRIIVLGSHEVFLMAGDSWRAMHLTVAMASVQLPILWFAIANFGIGGAIVAPALSLILIHPLRARYLRLYGGWDGRGEAMLLAFGLAVTGWAVWQSRDAILPLFGG